MASNVRVVINKRAIEALASTNEVAKVLVDRATDIQGRAQADAPVSPTGSNGRRPGYLRANIRVKYGKDARSGYADVRTVARTPRGFPYGRLQEQRQPYLKPALGQ